LFVSPFLPLRLVLKPPRAQLNVMPSSNNGKRSQPIAAKQRKGGSKSSTKSPRGSPNSNEPSSLTPPVTTAASASKRVAKAVRSGKGTKSKTKKIGDGPEAELSDEEDVVVYPVDGDDGETTPEPEERALGERVVEGVSGRSIPKNEINMDTLIAGAKPRPGESKRVPHRLDPPVIDPFRPSIICRPRLICRRFCRVP
jgi:hypothetical protein